MDANWFSFDKCQKKIFIRADLFVPHPFIYDFEVYHEESIFCSDSAEGFKRNA